MKYFYLLFLLIAIGLGNLNGYAQVVQVKKNIPAEQPDPRIDNMGYWMKMAEKGLVPYTPDIPVKPAEFKGTWLEVGGAKVADSPDVPVTNLTNVTESENSIFVDPDNNQYVLNSNNSTSWNGGSIGSLYGANYFQSGNGGLTWMGTPQGAGGSNSGDPTTAISRSGRQYVNYINNSSGQSVAYSDNGTSWNTASIAPNPGQLADKNHMWIDNSMSSPYQGNLYAAWTDFGGSYNYQVVISRSTNNGVTWSSRVPISGSISTFDHGVNLQTGPNGEVYAVWATYPSSGLTENGIGYTKSLDGGATFSTPVKIISNIKGIRETGVLKNMRVNSFPVAAVDVSGGTNNGTIYVVWTNIGTPGINTGTNKSVYIIKSTNGGTTWSTPVKVNQGAFVNGKEAYSPWITCDPETGALAVVFYDDRNTSSTMCETWVAYSVDAGSTWTDFRVSDVAFTPNAIPGLASSYMGDYLGITSKGGRVYPCWTDTRNGLYMTYVSPFVLGLDAAFTANPTSVCTGGSVTFTDQSGGQPTGWNWSFPGGTPSSYSGQTPPTIVYNTPGTYDVTLTVTKGSESNTETKTGYITVQDIIANFSGTPTMVVTGNSVTFSDLSSCNPTGWTWSFPGGSPSGFSGQTPPAITYNTAGTYNVSLTVTKPGATDTETKTNYITVVPPEFNMTNGTVTTCTGNFYDSGGPSGEYQDNEDYTMTFYPSTTGAQVRMTFTSFSTEAGYDYLRIYNGTNTSAPLIGTYNGTTGPGTITASNASGALTFNFTSDVYITSGGWAATISCYSNTQPPVANFTASTTSPVIGQTVTFTDQSTNIPTSWAWSFSPNTVTYVNGTSSTTQNPQVQFNNLGQYTVTLVATNAFGSDTEVKTNYINCVNCSYCASQGNYVSSEYMSNVTFNTINNSSGGVGYQDFTYLSTNVNSGSSYNLSVSVQVVGTRTQHIWAWIDWNQNCSFTDAGESYDLGQRVGTGSLSISIPVPANAIAGATRMRVSERYNSDPTSCLTFNRGEVEDYTLIVQNVPLANFTASTTTPALGQTVTFTDISAGSPVTWNWSFSPNTVTFVGGTSSNSQNPQVQFNATGYYTVTLVVTNSFGSDTEEKINYIFAQNPPVADFIASNTTPAVGQAVTFTDLTTNSPTSWNWSFTPNTVTYIGGTSSGSQNPQVQFNVAGSYTVSLTATNMNSSDTEIKTNYILATIMPVADFIAGNTNPLLGSTVSFTDLTTNSPTSWAWSFSPNTVSYVDGTSSASQNPQVKFNGGGYYTVTLVVVNAYGTDSETKNNYINVTAPPVANFAASTTTAVTGQTVTFTDLSANAPTSWQWFFTPGTVAFVGGTDSFSQNPQVQFTAGGYYTVSLVASNLAGTGGETKTDYIAVSDVPVAEFSAGSTNPLINQIVSFTDLSTNIPTSWNWSFTPNTVNYTGGTASTSQNPQVQFTAGGYYSVTLTASNSQGSDTETKTSYIFVTAQPVADFTVDNTTPVINQTVHFTDLTANQPTIWFWTITPNTVTWVNGTIPTMQNPQVQFTAGGYYTVTLTVTNASGTDSETKTNYINVPIIPVAAFTADITNPVGNQVVSFTDQSTNAPTAWNWSATPATISFTGGTSASSQNPQIQFNATGNYNITLTASNLAGSDYEYKFHYIYSVVAPVTDFIAYNTTPLVNQTVALFDQSSNTPDTWNWTITPNTFTYIAGTNSSSSNIQVKFLANGYYTVSLTSANIAGSDSETKVDYIYVTGGSTAPVANFSADNVTPTQGQTVQFTDLSTNTPVSWTWTFDPGTVSYTGGTGGFSQHPQVTFDAPGYYSVTLVASNAGGSDSETKTNYIFVTAPPDADFVASNTMPLTGETITFTDLSTNDPTTWLWSFIPGTVTYTGGTNAISQNPQVNFDAPGFYTVSLTVTNAAGSDTETKNLYIYVTSPFIELNLTALLEGPFNGSTMNTYINGYVPASQPYSGAPWNYSGAESVASVPANAVDWILVELRETAGDASTATSGTRLARQAGFILSNGLISGIDGSDMKFTVTLTSNLYVVIYHRNHLSIMSSNPLLLSGGKYSYDFTTGSNQIYGGTIGCKQLSLTQWGMISADGNSDGNVNTSDNINVWSVQVGSSGYKMGDFNMNGNVDNVDKINFWRPNSGKSTQIPN